MNPLKLMFIAPCGYYLHFCADSPPSSVFLPLIGWILSTERLQAAAAASENAWKQKQNVIRSDGKNHADLRSVTPTMKTHHTERALKPLKSHLRKIKGLLKSLHEVLNLSELFFSNLDQSVEETSRRCFCCRSTGPVVLMVVLHVGQFTLHAWSNWSCDSRAWTGPQMQRFVPSLWRLFHRNPTFNIFYIISSI